MISLQKLDIVVRTQNLYYKKGLRNDGKGTDGMTGRLGRLTYPRDASKKGVTLNWVQLNFQPLTYPPTVVSPTSPEYLGGRLCRPFGPFTRPIGYIYEDQDFFTRTSTLSYFWSTPGRPRDLRTS